MFLVCCTRTGITLPETSFPDWPDDDDDQVAALDQDARLSYDRAQVWQERHAPDSIPTDITAPQLLSIQEKGVSAFEFEWDPESSCNVAARTEIQFVHGECSVHTNLPLPRNQEVYYWEAKMFDKPDTTTVAVGVTTQPYPSWRLPGWNRYSVGYFSSNGNKYFSSPFHGKPYGLTFRHGDVVGVGYRHCTGTLFFTRNGRKLDDAVTGLRWNLFPTIGATGPCQVHVNLGQAGFVFVEANVKKWGLAAAQGSLAPPPAYGLENDTVLLAAGSSSSAPRRMLRQADTVDDAVLITLDDDDDDDETTTEDQFSNRPPPYSSPLDSEPVKVSNVYDATQLKNALDDELAKYIESTGVYSRSHQHTHVKLCLGYASVLIAAGSFLYEQKHGFHYGKFGTLGCVIAFWFLQAASVMYTYCVENNEIFVGYLYKDDNHVGTLSVTTHMDRHSPNYLIKYLYSDVKGRKHTRVETTASVSGWFTDDGTLVESKFDDHIKASLDSVTKSLHKD
ncbi:hypothetical protein [Absidia glauca]|uniref:Signal peptidase complex subunit 2 n=1 Tax=Absidia glauca TaxID=4829 RepID=A0A163K9B6_ABSGL|nr:hypothetical protein [Absidia glauca]